MEIAVWPALIAGFIGGGLMVVMRTIMKAAGLDLPLDIARVWGTMVGLQGDVAWFVGLWIHLLGSAGIGLIYAWAFDWLGITSTFWVWGLLGGVIHWIIAELFFAMLPAMHREIPDERPAPGPFLVHFGSPSVPVFFAGHVMYGVVVSVLYGVFA